jgi:DNA modification methylase
MIDVPEIKLVNTGKLIVDKSNPNAMSTKSYEALKRNIERYGFLIPVITNKEYKIADGFHRWKAARDLGVTEVPVIALDIDEVDRRMLRQILNKLRGEHDPGMDSVEYQFILEQGQGDIFEQLSTMSVADLDNHIEAENPMKLQEDNFDTEAALEMPKYDVKNGDIWELGDHRLMCGSATSPEDMAKLMQQAKAQLILTDPPYGVSYKGNTSNPGKDWEMIEGDDLRGNDLYDLLFGSFKQAAKYTDDQPAVYVFYSSSNTLIFFNALIKAGFTTRQQLIWAKGHVLGHSHYHWSHEPVIYASKEKHARWFGNHKHKTLLMELKKGQVASMAKEELIDLVMEIKNQSTLQEFSKGNVMDYEHPTQKPVEIYGNFIRVSTQKDEIILEPFCGSGTAIIAAEHLGRKCRAMELDPKYCSVIIERWEALTENKAERVEKGE